MDFKTLAATTSASPIRPSRICSVPTKVVPRRASRLPGQHDDRDWHFSVNRSKLAVPVQVLINLSAGSQRCRLDLAARIAKVIAVQQGTTGV